MPGEHHSNATRRDHDEDTFDAVLFDMDGTLIDSTAGVVGAWHTFKIKYPTLDITEILNTSHGVRTVDNLRLHCGITDPDELESEAVRFEEEIVNSSRTDGIDGIVRLPGVSEVIDSLFLASDSSPTRWAICTSATRAYATQALQIAGIPQPKNFVCAEDVTKGKPYPDPYLLGAKMCGVEPSRCLVFEDAPSGISSGRAAGCKTLAVVTTHSKESMQKTGADYLVKNLSEVKLELTLDGKIHLQILKKE
ncbi:phosphatase [Schizopora paradoxa]|uniref:Phosphatase n=1 Tax=Schizopora paradoxa TaxID=27342 RepID=A0A0H2S135_9AGAM|nr:phosphatase [Schizopora paradoxa]